MQRMAVLGSENTRQPRASISARRASEHSVQMASSVSGWAARSFSTRERSTAQNASDRPPAAKKPSQLAKFRSRIISSALRSSRVTSLVTWPVMSTGLRGAANGTHSSNWRWAASDRGCTSRLAALASSAIMAPTPPETVSRPRERLRGIGAMEALAASAKKSLMVWARSTPYWRNTAS